MPRVFIPPAMRDLIPHESLLVQNAVNVRAVIESLEKKFPGAKDRLCQGEQLRPGLSVSVDGSASSLGLRQTVDENGEVHFLPAIGGG